MKPLGLLLLFSLATGCGAASAPINQNDASPDVTDSGADAPTPEAGRDVAVDAGFPCAPLPEGCNKPVPSYSADIAPLLRTRCAPCHFKGGTEDFMYDLSTWSSVDNADTAIQSQIYPCLMPPIHGIPKLGVPPAPPMTATERLTLWDWLQCGALDN